MLFILYIYSSKLPLARYRSGPGGAKSRRRGCLRLSAGAFRKMVPKERDEFSIENRARMVQTGANSEP